MEKIYRFFRKNDSYLYNDPPIYIYIYIYIHRETERERRRQRERERERERERATNRVDTESLVLVDCVCRLLVYSHLDLYLPYR